MAPSFMRFMFQQFKQSLKRGDTCSVKEDGIVNLPQIVKENNELMFIGEFSQNKELVAICSSIYVNELIFIQKDLLTKMKKQPNGYEKMSMLQLDLLTTLKEISFQLKTLAKNNIEYEEELSPSLIDENDNKNFH